MKYGISPPELSIWFLLLYALALLLPEGYYFDLIGEEYYVKILSWASVYVALSWLVFNIGYAFSPKINSSPIILNARRTRSYLAFVILLIFAILLTGLSNILVIQKNPFLIGYLLANQGAQIKTEADFSGTLSLASVWSSAIIWWVLWKRPLLAVGTLKNVVLSLLIISAILMCFISSTLKVARGELMPILVGVGVVFIARKIYFEGLSPLFIIRYLSIGGLSAIFLFLTFSVVRGSDGDVLLADLVGYTLASYNRLAAIVDGWLRYPYGGSGVYIAGFVSFNNMLNALLPFNEWFGWAPFDEVWTSEFGAVWQAGLNGNLIWPTALGYLFLDLGWFALLYMFALGFVSRFVWRDFLVGGSIGLALYPWFAFCILFWFGSNYIFDTKFLVYLLAGIFLYFFERIFVKYDFIQVNRQIYYIGTPA